jgi:hypothetical protein
MTCINTRPTVPAPASSQEAIIARKLEADRLRRIESARNAEIVQTLIDAPEVRELCRGLVRGDQFAQRKLALVMLLAEVGGGS